MDSCELNIMGTCSHMIPYTHVVSVHIRGQA